MATGPFGSRGNQAQEIRPVSQAGGFDVAPGAAEAANQLAGVVLPALKNNRIKQIEEEITGQTESVKTALLARANPVLAQSLFTEEALANPVTRAAFEQYNDIANAVAQGRLPGAFALERLTVIQNDAIANAPEFEQEIRQGMLQATGQDPEKRLFAKLMSDQAQDLSPQEKARRNVEQRAFEFGVSPEAIVEKARLDFDNQSAEAKLKQQSILGTVDFNGIAASSRRRSGDIMVGIMQESIVQLNTGEGLTPDFIAGVKARVAMSIAAATSEIIATAGDQVDPKDIALAIQPLEKLQGQIEGMVDSTSWLDLISNRNLLNKELILGELGEVSPAIAAAHALGGPVGVVPLLQMLDRASSPEMKELLGKLSPGFAVATATGDIAAGVQFVPTPNGIVNQYQHLGTGTVNLNVKAKNERIIAANTAIQTVGGKEDVMSKAVQDLESVSPDHAWVAFDNRKVVQATLQSKTLTAKVITLQANQTAGLSQEYFNIAALPGFRADKFFLDNGELQYKQELSPLTPQGALSELDKVGPMFVRRFNTSNRISATYAGVGVIPASRYQGVQAYFDVVKSSVKELIEGDGKPKQKTPGAQQWKMDEVLGIPVRVNE